GASAGEGGSWGIAWRSERTGEVHAARAAPTGADWQVQQIRPAAQPSQDPDWYDPDRPYGAASFVAMPSGVRLVAWAERAEAFGQAEAFGNDSDIFFARSADDGKTWSTPSALSAYAAIDAARDASPSLAADGSGRVLAV